MVACYQNISNQTVRPRDITFQPFYGQDDLKRRFVNLEGNGKYPKSVSRIENGKYN